MELTAKEKISYRNSKHFRQIRKELLEKANNRCECCGVKKGKKYLQCHHVDETKYKEEDEKEYLKVLCCECHQYIENKIRVIKNKKNNVPVGLLLFLSPFSEDAKKMLEERTA